VTAPAPTLLCVVPNPSVDRTAEVDRLEVGAIHRPASVLAVPGGKGLNVARAAWSLGASVGAVVLLGGHAGRWIDEELDRIGIRHEAGWVDATETRTCLSVLDRSTGRMTEVYEPSAAVPAATWRRFEALVAGSIAATPPASLVAVSGSFPTGVGGAAGGRLVRAARRAGRRILVDTSGPWLSSALEARPDLVKINAAEAAAVLGRAVETEADALAAAVDLAGAGARTAIVTRGPLGAVGWDGARGWAVDPPVVDGSHAVGSGDAFLAGLGVAILRSEPFERQLRRAAAAAAASLIVAGPGNLRRRAAERLIAETAARRLR
jgi:1-phosphofructokinase family hexose kinase